MQRTGIVMTLRSRQNGHFADNIFKCIFLSENCCILIRNPLKYVQRAQKRSDRFKRILLGLFIEITTEFLLGQNGCGLSW